MSQVRVTVEQLENNFVEVKVDGQSCGMMTDRESELKPILKNIFDKLDVNVVVEYEGEDD